jgi:hypothetical protein
MKGRKFLPLDKFIPLDAFVTDSHALAQKCPFID